MSIIVLKVIRSMDNKKEDYYDYDTEVYDFGLYYKLFTELEGNEMGFKSRDLHLVMDFTY